MLLINILTIEFSEYISSDEILISITDISDKSVLTLSEALLHNRIQINTISLEKGVYFITLKFDKGSFTRILIKE